MREIANESSHPIGLFDSGFGGLTVMKELSRFLPRENLIYLGDSAHLPYGNKSPETVIDYALECALFLKAQNIKLLIIACHTACSHALKIVEEKLSIPVIGVINPGIEKALQFGKIAILATQSTINSGIYQKEISPYAHIFPKACPLFVPLIEEGYHDHPLSQLIANEYLSCFKNQIDAALLACTHYPLLKKTITTVLGEGVQLIDPATPTAQNALDYLLNRKLLNNQNKKPLYQFFTSGDPEKFSLVGKNFWGSSIEKVEKKQEFMKLF